MKQDDSTLVFQFEGKSGRVERRDQGRWYGIKSGGQERCFYGNKGHAINWVAGATRGVPKNAAPTGEADAVRDRLAALKAAKTKVEGSGRFAELYPR